MVVFFPLFPLYITSSQNKTAQVFTWRLLFNQKFLKNKEMFNLWQVMYAQQNIQLESQEH